MAYTQRIFYHRPSYEWRNSAIRLAAAAAFGAVIGFVAATALI